MCLAHPLQAGAGQLPCSGMGSRLQGGSLAEWAHTNWQSVSSKILEASLGTLHTFSGFLENISRQHLGSVLERFQG
eukprot:1140176-Pelagomonas_calceolata.AAC.4